MRAKVRLVVWVQALVAAMALALVASGPVAAAGVVDTDVLSLGQNVQGKACYGLCGGVNPTTLEWRLYDGTPKLRGVTGYGALGVAGPNPAQICARVKAIFRAKNGTKLATRAGSGVNVVCLPSNTGGNGRGGTPIDNYKPVYKPNLYSVRVVLQRGPTATGPWTDVQAVTCVWKTTDCNIV